MQILYDKSRELSQETQRRRLACDFLENLGTKKSSQSFSCCNQFNSTSNGLTNRNPLYNSVDSENTNKSVKFDNRNRELQGILKESPKPSLEIDQFEGASSSKYSNHPRNNSNRSSSCKARVMADKLTTVSEKKKRSNSNTSSNRILSENIQDGFNCITKDGLGNVYLTYFFKLPSCSPSDRTQVRIENHNILKLKIIQEKNFLSKAQYNENKRKKGWLTKKTNLKDLKEVNSSISSESTSSSSNMSDTDNSEISNQPVHGFTSNNNSSRIMLREFSRRCKIPNNLFKFDENAITFSFVNNIWVRVEIPIEEILTNPVENLKSFTSKKQNDKNRKNQNSQHLNQSNKDLKKRTSNFNMFNSHTDNELNNSLDNDFYADIKV